MKQNYRQFFPFKNLFKKKKNCINVMSLFKGILKTFETKKTFPRVGFSTSNFIYPAFRLTLNNNLYNISCTTATQIQFTILVEQNTIPKGIKVLHKIEREVSSAEKLILQIQYYPD